MSDELAFEKIFMRVCYCVVAEIFLGGTILFSQNHIVPKDLLISLFLTFFIAEWTVDRALKEKIVETIPRMEL